MTEKFLAELSGLIPLALTKRIYRAGLTRNQGTKVAPHYHKLLWIPQWVVQEMADWIRYWKLELARIPVADGKALICTARFKAGTEVKIEDKGPDVQVVRRQMTGRKEDCEIVEYWKMDGINHLTDAASQIAGWSAGQIVEPKKAIQSWFAVMWYEIVGSGDRGHGECWLRRPDVAGRVEQVLRAEDGRTYRLRAWALMPNHVHLVLDVWQTPLSSLLQHWKGRSAREANKVLKRRGNFWEREYFDTMIEDETHLRKAVRYTENNPMKAGFVGAPKQWL